MDRERQVSRRRTISYPSSVSSEGTVRQWSSSFRLMHHDSLPDWMKDNDYLLNHHRPQLNSYRKCFRTVFQLHTETINIWTHLLGFLGFMYLSIDFALFPPVDTWQGKLVYQIFFFSAMICLGCSALFHTLSCHSPDVSRFFSRLDYCGITMLIHGSFIPCVYYAFLCDYVIMQFYIIMITVLATCCAIVSSIEAFSMPKLRPVRAGLFILLGLSGVIPGLHYTYLFGLWVSFTQAGLCWLLLMGFFYIIGATIYAMRVPERIFPGYCDVLFQSHQVFHVFVNLGAFIHLHAIHTLAGFRASNPCEVPTLPF